MGGADTLYGGAGDDVLYGYGPNTRDMSNQLATGSYAASSQGGNDNLYGQAGDDTLMGSAGDNTLDGGTGADTIYSGAGSDMMILRVGDGGTTLVDADTIADFTDGTDKLGMDDNLLFSELTIAQGTGSNSNDTVISKGSEYLAILIGISASVITEADFTPVDIA